MYMRSTDGWCEFSLFVQMAIVIYQPFQVMNIQKCEFLETQNFILASRDSILTSWNLISSSFEIRQSSAILKSRLSTYFWGYCMYLGNLRLRLLLSVRLTFTFTCTQVRSVCTRFSVALDNWIMCNMNISNLCFCY